MFPSVFKMINFNTDGIHFTKIQKWFYVNQGIVRIRNRRRQDSPEQSILKLSIDQRTPTPRTLFNPTPQLLFKLDSGGRGSCNARKKKRFFSLIFVTSARIKGRSNVPLSKTTHVHTSIVT